MRVEDNCNKLAIEIHDGEVFFVFELKDSLTPCLVGFDPGTAMRLGKELIAAAREAHFMRNRNDG